MKFTTPDPRQTSPVAVEFAPHTAHQWGMAGLAALRVAARLKSKGARSHIRSVEEQAQYLSEERRDEELYVRASAGDHERVGKEVRGLCR